MLDRGQSNEAVVHRTAEYPRVAQTPMKALLPPSAQRQNRIEARIDECDSIVDLESSVTGQPGKY
jgi:hypothetical protein